MSSYLVLLQVGFTIAVPVTSHAVRSYRTFSPLPVIADLGGFLSAALSVGSRPPGVTWHLTLWSPDFPLPLFTRNRGSDCLADFMERKLAAINLQRKRYCSRLARTAW